MIVMMAMLAGFAVVAVGMLVAGAAGVAQNWRRLRGSSLDVP